MGKKYVDTDWDFREADTKTYTHCFHSYPAMMIPQVAGRLIDLYGTKAKLIFDPYCGTGTSLVEANLRGINAIGTDLNPLAILIAMVKTTSPDIGRLDVYLKEFNDYVFSLRFSVSKIDTALPGFKNIDYWFDRNVQLKLSVIKDFINRIPDDDVANFFKVAFSETVRESSWTRKGEFKLFRMNDVQMAKFKPDVYGIMENKLARNHKGLLMYLKDKKGDADSKLYNFNTVEGLPKSIFPSANVDIIVTSPPYGDSHTTVAYGQYSRLASQWLDLENSERLDNLLMGGKPKNDCIEFGSNTLTELISKINSVDPKRCLDVISFYIDYQRSIDNVSKIIKKNGYACYVVGNRRVKGVTLETDEITKDFFEANGFKHVQTIIRNIPNKRMPSKNSPSNIVGQLDTTMSNEYIVIMKKTK